MNKNSGKASTYKEALKKIIKRLYTGEESPESVKSEFKEILSHISPDVISKAEEELIQEGMPQEEIHKLCDIHIAILKERLADEKPIAPWGHPIHILMEEHKILIGLAQELHQYVSAMPPESGFDEHAIEKLNHIANHFKSAESHYVREENVLFPYLEKYGIKQPPAIMWTEHDKIREMKKSYYKLVESAEKRPDEKTIHEFKKISIALAEMLSNHFFKENRILFPTALKVIYSNEWKSIRTQFDELGYCCFTPATEKIETESSGKMKEPDSLGFIKFETGQMTKEEVEAIFNSMPVDITFVDSEDKVRFFSQTIDRIFPRTKAVIGRKVQNCHPQKSVHVVNEILEDFKNGKRDVAEFWIQMNSRFIYIRYFPVRNLQGDYLGCLEVTQDISELRNLEGEKRLL